jgi:hypothetical protein
MNERFETIVARLTLNRTMVFGDVALERTDTYERPFAAEPAKVRRR